MNMAKCCEMITKSKFYLNFKDRKYFLDSICTFSIHLIADSAKVSKRSLPDGAMIQNIRMFILPWEMSPKSKVSFQIIASRLLRAYCKR